MLCDRKKKWIIEEGDQDLKYLSIDSEKACRTKSRTGKCAASNDLKAVGVSF